MSVPASHLLPTTDGLEAITLKLPSYSFLIQHSSGRALLFDLGLRKDYWKHTGIPTRAPPGWQIDVDKNVSDILEENSVPLVDIEAVIWSHHHADHVGDVTMFPPSTKVIVGPKFKEHYVSPSLERTPDLNLLAENMKGGRELVEVSFDDAEKGLKVGPSRAYDYFGDGSFYLLDSPGHTYTHMAALARVTTSPEDASQNSFILMAGDTCHFPGQLRPTVNRSIPKECPTVQSLCPGVLLQRLLERSESGPLFGVDEKNVVDFIQAQKSVQRLQSFDSMDNVWVIVAHEQALLDNIEFFPANLNDWKEKGYSDKVRWGFLKALEK